MMEMNSILGRLGKFKKDNQNLTSFKIVADFSIEIQVVF